MKKTKSILVPIVFATLILTSCGTNGSKESSIITEKNQLWMSENLKVDTFRNGDPIPFIENDEDWFKAGKNKQPAWCFYDNELANDKKYGKLYNWYAVNDSRGLAPKGWHIPSDKEWTELIEHLGGEEVAGKKMKSASGWKEDGNGANESGFLGLPGGYRYNSGGFVHIGELGAWWSSTLIDAVNSPSIPVYTRNLNNGDNANRFLVPKESGLSVRCVRD